MLRVAILGAGYFAGFHVDGWRRVAGAQPVAVADMDIGKATATGLTPYTALAPMLTAERPDILDIVTPPHTHAAAIGTAIDAGVPTVICQKPFCTSLEQAEAMTARAQAAGITLIVHENFRFQPWYRAIRDTIQQGRIGELHQITFRLRTGDGQGPRAYLDRQPYFQKMPRFLVHETAVHWIDTFRFLMGEATDVYADLRRMNPAIAGEDAGHILFSYPQGRRALFDGNRLLDHAAENHRMTLGEALVEGSSGTLSLSGDGAVHLRALGQRDSTTVLPARQWLGFAGDCVTSLNAHVVAGLSGGGAFENHARDYLSVRRIEEAIYRSADLGQRVALGDGMAQADSPGAVRAGCAGPAP
jgi:predicted dehydrogenase